MGDTVVYTTTYWETFQTKEELEKYIETVDKDKIVYITEILDEKDFDLSE